MNVAQLDEKFDRLLEPARHNRVVQGFFSLLSRAGEFSLIWHAVIWLRAIGSADRAKDAVVFSLLLGAESLIVNQGLKRIFRRQRLAGVHGVGFPNRTQQGVPCAVGKNAYICRRGT